MKRNAFDVPSSRKEISASLLKRLGLSGHAIAPTLTCVSNHSQAQCTEVITDVVVAFATAKILDDDLFEAGGATVHVALIAVSLPESCFVKNSVSY